jgi:mannose-1-phosphate guanylyltransferase
MTDMNAGVPTNHEPRTTNHVPSAQGLGAEEAESVTRSAVGAPRSPFHGLILAGGEGTRLRPLTHLLPKPVIPLVNRPFLHYQLDLLRDAGIFKAALLAGYGARRLKQALGESACGLDLTYIEEKEPLGTGGAIGNAGRILKSPAVVTNGDVLTDLDIAAVLRFHAEKGGIGTLVLCPVEDPRRYGVVTINDGGRIVEFLEKPEHPPSNLINAGFYILEPEFFDLIPEGRCSIERDIFPKALHNTKGLYAYVHRGYWKDIGTLASYREAGRDLLTGGLKAFHAQALKNRILSPVDGAAVDRLSIIGPECVLGRGVVVEDSVIFPGVRIGAGCRISDSILATGMHIAPGRDVENEVLVSREAEGREG